MTIELETVELDVPALSARFARRLADAGVPVTPDRAVRFAEALTLTRPVARRRLYWTARTTLVSDPAQVPAFDRAFHAVFGAQIDHDFELDADAATHTRPPDAPAGDPLDGRASDAGRAGASPAAAAPSSLGDRPQGAEQEREVAVPMAASDEERLRAKRFDAIQPDELVTINRLMAELRLVAPLRRMRRAEHHRRGERIDLRRTLRAGLRSGGDPIHLAQRRRRVVPRRIVLLCDISGSMEPYARAYLQFLATAAGSGTKTEAFVFATRLTRVTRALAMRSPERAMQRAAAAAPDWSSGTRIGDALRTFNDRYGRRGVARGAIVVILSDGWERGDPALVAREMERLSRLAYRIVWVNPRVSARGWKPSAAGMAAALPHIDALVSGHSLAALTEVVAAIGAERGSNWWVPEPPPAVDNDEPWGSATPVAGSSVAMPSGYGPSRGNTTPGWSQ